MARWSSDMSRSLRVLVADGWYHCYAADGQAIRSFGQKLSRGDLRAAVSEAEKRLAINLHI